MSVLIIAEAGVNHNGSLELAKSLVDAAVDAGADFVKFQTFKANSLLTTNAPKAEYQVKNAGAGESQFEMIRRLELSEEMHEELWNYCAEKNIGFLSTGFDIASIDYLKKLGVGIFKVPSGELTNLPLLRHIGSFKRDVILSTGMACLGEIEEAINIVEEAGTPRIYITVLHCTTEYPTPMEDVNLRAMVNISNALGVKAGYSDHTPGIEIPIAAVALGATVIEKHFTLDRNLPGPDHRASLEPDELNAMVAGIRNIERALGDGIKRPSLSELKNKPIARKSLVAAADIKAGELFSAENLATKRPGTGVSPMLWDQVIGRSAPRDFNEDELIEL
ncbi:N-acetylneuraminate synthase [uncultured Marinobacter sp.]|uniref:N-acetylneuraminate synthase n=1 Tax=uncultured Marinobacter sp. TaxID=187379 RepID=UPI0030D82E36|tara:strand:+ start:1741 stop:2742 length:1002 start_codon:yes stop_codon:yes gene_type:complete